MPSTIFMTNAIVPPNEETQLAISARSEGGDLLVRGLNLRAQLGDGRGPMVEPVFKDVNYENTIWSPYEIQVIGGVVASEPQFVQSIVVLLNEEDPSLVAEGPIARVTIDTRNIRSGSFELHFSNTPFEADTDFAGVPAELVNGTITIARPGDSNLDGRFNSTDFLQVLQRGEYEDNVPLNSDWSDGDWNNNGDFETGDLVYALQVGNYVFA